MEQLSPRNATIEPMHPRAHAPQQEATTVNPHTTMKSSSHSLQLEKACMQQQRLSAAKNTLIKILKKDNCCILVAIL